MIILGNLLLGLALASCLVGIGLMMAMAGALQQRGHRVNWFLIRLLIPRYVHLYQSETRAETGRPGPLFYPFLVAMNSALVLALVGLVLRSL